jgi:hypothetical protein
MNRLAMPVQKYAVEHGIGWAGSLFPIFTGEIVYTHDRRSCFWTAKAEFHYLHIEIELLNISVYND